MLFRSAILLTDHREMETLTITDRNYIICEGRVLVSGDSETVLANPEAQAKYFGKRSYHDTGMFHPAGRGPHAGSGIPNSMVDNRLR